MRTTIAYFLAILAGFLGVFSHAAAADEKVEGPGISGVAQVMWHATKNKSEQRSLLGKIVYLEKVVSGDTLTFLQVYHDQEFYSAIIGVSQKWGDFQGAFGIGTAWYNNTTRTILNPWLYYSNEETGVEGLLYAERYRHDREDPWFFKGHVQKKFDNRMIAGVYGESFAGIGPMVGYQVTKNFNVRVVAPVAKQPDTGRMHALVLLSYSF